MKLDRNQNADGTGKYALVNLRKFRSVGESEQKERIRAALRELTDSGVLEWGSVGAEDEFFVIKLKDINAEYALLAYADQAQCNGDEEWAQEVADLAKRAGPCSKFCKHPD